MTIIGLVSLRHDAESVSASGLTKKKKKKRSLCSRWEEKFAIDTNMKTLLFV